MILFVWMDSECAPEQKAGYLSQLKSLEFYSKTFTLEPIGLPLLIAEDLKRCWLMKPEGDWRRLDGQGVERWEDRELICGSGLVTSNKSQSGKGSPPNDPQLL